MPSSGCGMSPKPPTRLRLATAFLRTGRTDESLKTVVDLLIFSNSSQYCWGVMSSREGRQSCFAAALATVAEIVGSPRTIHRRYQCASASAAFTSQYASADRRTRFGPAMAVGPWVVRKQLHGGVATGTRCCAFLLRRHGTCLHGHQR